MKRALKKTRHPLETRHWDPGSYRDRFERVRPYVTGKTVLDVGCAVGHHRSDWMHGLISRVATDVVAVDNNEMAVGAIRAKGHDVLLADAQRFRLDRRFEVIFAGELIEHLDDFGGFFESVRDHLERDGVLVLTTPNAFAYTNFLYRLWGTPSINPDHRCWFCQDTIAQLLSKNGFRVVHSEYVAHRTVGTLRRILAALVRWFLPERLGWGTMLVVAKPLELGTEAI